MSETPSITFDHIGVVVQDLETVAAFFAAIGFDREEPFEVGGPWVDRIIGIPGTQVRGMFVSAPGGSGRLELIQFLAPNREGDQVDLPANALGFRHIAYQVADIEAVVAQARAAGYALTGEVVHFEDVFRLAYIRGPEGLIVEVAQPLTSN